MATPIKLLRSHQQYEVIVARISRGWTNNDFTTGRVISHDYILVDEEVRIY